MAWKIELSAQVNRDLAKLDPQQSNRILKFLHERGAPLVNPRNIGQALQGSRLGEFWKYRVGEYRLICKIEDDRLLILVLRADHRLRFIGDPAASFVVTVGGLTLPTRFAALRSSVGGCFLRYP